MLAASSLALALAFPRHQHGHLHSHSHSHSSHCQWHLLSGWLAPSLSIPLSRASRYRRLPLAAQVEEPLSLEDSEGPLELPSSAPSIFATTDDPTPLQVATSVLLTGAISVFLFRSIRRRAKRAKELKFRSSGAKKTLKEEAIDSLKAMGTASITSKATPSPVQAFIGGLTAAVIALILYKFTITIEASLNRQTLSDNFSVRQITITIRTIINGLCYLATFVFGINALGLFLYSGQLALNSSSEETPGEVKERMSKDQSRDGTEVSGTSEDKTSGGDP